MHYRLTSVPLAQFNTAVRQLDSAKSELASLRAENEALRAQLASIRDETLEEAAKAEPYDNWSPDELGTEIERLKLLRDNINRIIEDMIDKRITALRALQTKEQSNG